MTPGQYTTIEDHIALLEEKGYLGPAFGEPSKIGSWLQEFRERFEQARLNAMTSRQKQTFSQPAVGRFDDQLEQVFFNFRFQFHPFKDTLTLRTLQARLGKVPWTYFLNGRHDLPRSMEVYEKLCRREGVRHEAKLLDRIQREYDRANDPFNDPHLDMNHPGFNQVNDLHKDPEYRESPPIDLSFFKSRPPRRKP